MTFHLKKKSSPPLPDDRNNPLREKTTKNEEYRECDKQPTQERKKVIDMSAVGSDSEGSESEETVTGVHNKETLDIESLTLLTDATLRETEISMDVFDGS